MSITSTLESNNKYYNNINHDVLNVIPVDAHTLLEVGCAAGPLAYAYKKINPNCYYTGVELSDSAAQKASNILDKVIVGNVEKMDNKALNIKTQSLDCIIYGDVLEHLYDPWKLLAKHKPLIKPNGTIIACIPNIAHWSIVASLIHGKFIYKDSGIMDRTHIRFFTENSIMEMFHKTGYHVNKLIGRSLGNKYLNPFLDHMQASVKNSGADWEKFKQRSAILQYIVIASPNES